MSNVRMVLDPEPLDLDDPYPGLNQFFPSKEDAINYLQEHALTEHSGRIETMDMELILWLPI